MADTADSWFFIPGDQTESILVSNISWPFVNISKDQFRLLQKGLGYRSAANIFLHTYATPLIAVGLAFSILLIGTLWHKAIVKKNSFYVSMMIVAVMDLAFLIFSVPHKVWYKKYKIDGSDSFIAMHALLIARGIMYSLSLASDMCAVVLTMERSLAIAKATLHKRLYDNYKKIIQSLLGFFVLLVSATRLHYCFDKRVKADGLVYYYTTTEFEASSFMGVTTMTSDIILPFVLLFAMAFLSTMFRVAVTKRQKLKKANVKTRPSLRSKFKNSIAVGLASSTQVDRVSSITKNATTTGTGINKIARTGQQNAADSNDMRSVVTLTLALDALFLLNQLGFCMYCTAELLLVGYSVTYESSYVEFGAWITINLWEAYSDVACTFAEILSHAFNFPLYMALSGSMRLEFRHFLKRVFKC